VREEDGAPPCDRIEALEDVLEEGVVGASLRRDAEEVAPHESVFHASRFHFLIE